MDWKICGVEIHRQYVKCLNLLNGIELNWNRMKAKCTTVCYVSLSLCVCVQYIGRFYYECSHCSFHINDLTNHFSRNDSIFITAQLHLLSWGKRAEAYAFPLHSLHVLVSSIETIDHIAYIYILLLLLADCGSFPITIETIIHIRFQFIVFIRKLSVFCSFSGSSLSFECFYFTTMTMMITMMLMMMTTVNGVQIHKSKHIFKCMAGRQAGRQINGRIFKMNQFKIQTVHILYLFIKLLNIKIALHSTKCINLIFAIVYFLHEFSI